MNAQQAAENAVKAAQKVQAILNDPDKIDDWVIRTLVWAAIIVPGYFFITNSDPYINALKGITGSDGNWFLSLAGYILVALVQYVELKPFMLQSTASNEMRKRVNQLALVAYGVDIAVCYHRWPIFGETIFGLPNFIDIQWGNIGSIVAIVFGFAIWFMVKKALGRKF